MPLIFRIDSIEPNRRLVVEKDVVEELVLSISRQGQLEPILIYQESTVFRIVDGEKRWRAIKRLGRLTIQVKIEKG